MYHHDLHDAPVPEMRLLCHPTCPFQYGRPENDFSRVKVDEIKAPGRGHCHPLEVDGVQEYVTCENGGRGLNARLTYEKVDLKSQINPGGAFQEEGKCVI